MQEKNLTAYLIIMASAIIANIAALSIQFIYYELPCPLCLLQRFGLLGTAYGTIMALKEKYAFRYLFIIIITNIFTLIAALRQVLLHILPHNHGYGSSFLELHYYTWVALLAFGLIIIVTMAPLLSVINIKTYFHKKLINNLKNLLYYLLILLCIINTMSTFLECGFTGCPANPIKYLELS